MQCFIRSSWNLFLREQLLYRNYCMFTCHWGRRSQDYGRGLVIEEFNTKDTHSIPNIRETWAILGTAWEDASELCQQVVC